MTDYPSEICQCHCVPELSLGEIHVWPGSIQRWFKLILKRTIPAKEKRKIKQISNKVLSKTFNFGKKAMMEDNPVFPASPANFKVGDIVRVRSEEEVRATFDAWSSLKGCMFMEAQKEFCDTTQQVLKIVERFVDERDYKVKKTQGVILLDGVICEGTPYYGRCDRACFYFWREEWLEKELNER